MDNAAGDIESTRPWYATKSVKGSAGILAGLVLGLCIGIAMHNVAVGLALGVALGVAFAAPSMADGKPGADEADAPDAPAPGER